MKTSIEDKLDRIADIWNYFILDSKFCSNKIKFNDDVKTNYFGDILNYFKDTLEIVFNNNKHSNFSDKFSFTISFLQAIYIQQDFIQEMLEIFNTSYNKGVLKKDSTYSKNRELRNELVGHPIRKNKGNLVSSTIFSYQVNEDEIQYLKYHKDNNFKFECKKIKIAEIQELHRQFIEKYLDFILVKLKSILDQYLSKLDNLQKAADAYSFKIVLNLVEIYFEAILHSDFVYDKASLLRIYDRRAEHLRYQNYINKFYNDLRLSLAETKNTVKDIFESKVIDKNPIVSLSLPIKSILFTDAIDCVQKPPRGTFHYEISKIASRNSRDFDFFGSILKSKCNGNDLVLSELEHMEQNFSDEIEYYTSLRLICLELKE